LKAPRTLYGSSARSVRSKTPTTYVYAAQRLAWATLSRSRADEWSSRGMDDERERIEKHAE
jgi:hypothetical protein